MGNAAALPAAAAAAAVIYLFTVPLSLR